MGISVVSFSSRAGGNCSQIGKLIRSSCKDAQLFDFSSFTVHPCGECGYECFSAPEKCPWSADMENRLLDAIIRAKTVYFTARERWDAIVVRDMEKDVSWDLSARQYRELYLKLKP